MALQLSALGRERFELLRPIGEGGMGVVYEAFDRVRGEAVALKTLREPNAESVYRMKREFRALAQLEHPSLVKLYDLFVEPDSCFFTMELVDGTDLTSYVAADDDGDGLMSTVDMASFRPFDEGALRHALAGLVRGLEALHHAGLMHRDLKPSNVRVSPQGRVVLLDFGLVVDAHASIQQTNAGVVTGTIGYMAPEQARGEQELTTACDLYALGVVLYEILTTRLPFDGPPMRVMLAKQIEDPAPPGKLIAGLPKDLEDLAMRLLARDPVARPSLEEVRTVIRDVRSAPPGRSSISSSSQRPTLAIIGRAPELGRLRELRHATAAGAPAIALVRGRSGIGKSALLSAFVRDTESLGDAIVLSGRCYECESVPFKGMDGIVDSLSRVLTMMAPEELGRVLPPNLAELATLFPVLRRVKPIGSAYARRSFGERNVQDTRSKGFACLRELLRRLAETSTLVLVLDDVQWADDDSARGIVELVRGSDPPAMMLAFGARPLDDAPVIRTLFGDDARATIGRIRSATIELEPLPMGVMRELARRELGDEPELIEQVASDSGGNPFAVGELVRFLREGDHDASAIDDVLRDDDTGQRSTIDRIVQRRVESLDARSRALLEMLAVAGEPTPADLLHRAVGLSEDDRSSLDVLRARSFVRTTRSSGVTMLDTAHDRIREAVFVAIPAAERERRHLALALAMEALESPQNDKLSRHFAAASEWALSRHHAILAAESAGVALAFGRAVELCEVAMGLAETDRDRHTDLQRYARALSAAGRHADAARVWEESSEISPESERRELRRRAAESWLHAGQLDRGLALLEKLGRAYGVRIPQSRWTALLVVIYERIRVVLRGLSFRIRPRETIRSTELERVRTLRAVALNYTPLDPYRGAIPISRYVRAALEVGDVEELIVALALEASLRAGLGRDPDVDGLFDVIAGLERYPGDELGPIMSDLARSFGDAMAGRSSAGSSRASGAIARLERSANVPAGLVAFGWWVVGMTCISIARVHVLESMQRYVETQEALSGPASELRLRAGYLPHLHMRIGRPELSASLLEEASWAGVTRRNVTFKIFATVYASWTRVYLDDDVARTMPILEKAQRELVQNGAWRSPIARGRVLSLVSSVALRLGRADLASAAHAAFGRASSPIERCYEAGLEGVHHLASDRTALAIRAFERQREVASKVGNDLAELTACWGLGHLAEGSARASARARFDAIVADSGMVDPDRFAWSLVPIGPAPERTGASRSERFA